MAWQVNLARPQNRGPRVHCRSETSSTRVGLMGCPGRYPTADRQGPQGVQRKRHNAPRVSSPPRVTRTPQSQCRRRRASASWPQAGRHIKLAVIAAGTGACFSNTTTTRRPSHISCLTFSQRQTAAVPPSFNGSRLPDAPLFQPQLIAVSSFPFQAFVLCVVGGSNCHMSKPWRTRLYLRACLLR